MRTSEKSPLVARTLELLQAMKDFRDTPRIHVERVAALGEVTSIWHKLIEEAPSIGPKHSSQVDSRTLGNELARDRDVIMGICSLAPEDAPDTGSDDLNNILLQLGQWITLSAHC